MNQWIKIFGSSSNYIEENLSLLKKNNNINKLLSFKLFIKIYSEKIIFRDFIHIMNFISGKLKLKKNQSLLDYGSGNGAILNYFLKKFFLKNNISIELNNSFIKYQKQLLNNTKFIKANFFETGYLKKIKNNSVDHVMCNSVFQYFISDQYAYEIIEEFIRITKKRIIIYDLKNVKKKKEYQEVVRKRQGLTKFKFKEKYLKTPIRFYDKEFFLKKIKLNKLVKSVKICQLPNETLDNKFGFCVIIEKN